MNRPESSVLHAAGLDDAALQGAALQEPWPQADAEIGSSVPARSWAQRNQQWLAQRLALWRERLAARMAGTSMDNGGIGPDLADDDFEPALTRVSRLFGLTAFESDVLLLAAGIEIDPALRDALAAAQGQAVGAPLRLSFALARDLLAEPHWDALSPSRPLRHWALLDVDSTASFGQGLLRIDERMLHELIGVAAVDAALAGVAVLSDDTGDADVDADADPRPGVDAQGNAAGAGSAHSALALRIAQAMAGLAAPLVLLAYPAHDAARRRSARALAPAALAPSGTRALWVDVSALAAEPRELLLLARRIDREAALAGAAVVFAPTAQEEASHGATITRCIAALRSPVLLVGELSPLAIADLPARQVLRFDVPSPLASALASALASPLASRMPPGRSAGRAVAPSALQHALDRALQQFHVEPAVLDQVVASIAPETLGTADAVALDATALDTAIWSALREAARGGLDALAQRIDSRAHIEDLVLPAPLSAQLREIVGQLRQRHRVHEDWGFAAQGPRGLGIAALFAGDSGTGKTFAAEAIANEAGLDLYRIDLASTVSKYIGETEKNLARLFDAAERSGAVLLFDEADALFGKRSEVKDSHDRYANIEVAYLLQRVESYRGLAILTTNMKSALDRAFLRRIRFVVQFPFPDEAAREQLWRRQFPPQAPLGQVDFKALAKLQLAGGHIRGVALNAAFLAAARAEPIGQAVLLAAARAEFAKLERNFNLPIGASA